jgi:hypothetical protein
VGVGSTVGDGGADALTLGATLAIDAPVGLPEGDEVGDEVEQATRTAVNGSTLANRRVPMRWLRLNAYCRCGPG